MDSLYFLQLLQWIKSLDLISTLPSWSLVSFASSTHLSVSDYEYGPSCIDVLPVRLYLWIIDYEQWEFNYHNFLLGGMKAVIWTDVWQSMWMLSGFVVIMSVACIDFGGISNIMDIAYAGNRFPKQYELDPRYRNTFWSVLLGTWSFFHNSPKTF